MKTPHTGDSHHHAETLGNALGLYSAESRLAILDRLGCYLHNEGHQIKGNTEANDALWLARVMVSKARGLAVNDWDRLTAKDQIEWQAAAALAIECLPALCDRIASRYVHAAVAVRSAEEMERARAKG